MDHFETMIIESKINEEENRKDNEARNIIRAVKKGDNKKSIALVERYKKIEMNIKIKIEQLVAINGDKEENRKNMKNCINKLCEENKNTYLSPKASATIIEVYPGYSEIGKMNYKFIMDEIKRDWNFLKPRK